MNKLQYIGLYLLFLAYYFDHWPYFKEYKKSCRIIAFILMNLSLWCFGFILMAD